jgi:hypothetical protein
VPAAKPVSTIARRWPGTSKSAATRESSEIKEDTVEASVEIQDVCGTRVDGSREQSLLAPPPRGEFVSARYESDCARFLAETKSLARRRAEAGLARPSVAH